MGETIQTSKWEHINSNTNSILWVTVVLTTTPTSEGTFSRRLREIGGLDEKACWGDTVLFTTVSRDDVIVRNAGQILTSDHYI